MEQADQNIPFGAYLEEYKRLGDDFQAAISFHDFFYLKSKTRPRGAKRAIPKTQSCSAHWGK